ncbi:MAG: SIR2 family protein [Caldilineaceae bacterium]|nr:SIR2 family protein [Caldilineaceae bacterium]
MTSIPHSLLEAIKEERAVLFLGAGASLGAKHPEGKRIPQGNQLRDLICDKFLGGDLNEKPLSAVSAMAASEAGLYEFQTFVRELFLPFSPADFHLLIPRFRWRAIATTNFDLIVERSYKKSQNPLQKLVKAVKNSDGFDARLNRETNPIGFYKLHGCIDSFEDLDVPLILSNEQYTRYEKNRDRFYNRFRDLGYENTLIFAGYSISDLHIQKILFDLTDPSVPRPPYFLISPGISEIEKRYWSQYKIYGLQFTLKDFLYEIDQNIPSHTRMIPSGIGGGSLSIRNHYARPQFTESASVVSYLANDVKHVFPGLNPPSQDPKEFYRGYDNGWGCITQNLDVRRSFSDSVLVDTVLLKEEEHAQVELFMLKGPGGNGKTVSLKRIAWEASIDYNKLVLFSEGPAGLNIDRLSEIHRLTDERVFLFVDRVALVRNELLETLEAAQSLSLPLSVIGAERDNEWHIYCEQLEPFVRQEFQVRYLSEGEVRDLLKLLEEHKALGLLESLSFEDRIGKFVERAERQLLVALHEATLGIPFEDIIVNEFERIEPENARRLYLYICALHQFDAPVRAGLISRASGISFEEFQERFLLPLEKVIHVKGGHNRDFYYRSRHQHVAGIVFSRMLPTGEERFRLLDKLLASINVDYSSDRETFDRLVKGRGIAEIFTDVELGRHFYNRIEAILPNEPFVLHQRAVFEMRHSQGSLDNAEEVAAKAFKLNSSSRSIRHTQAEISRRLANKTRDPLLKSSLRQFAQKKLGGKNEYDLVTRSRLALDKLKELAKTLNSSGNELHPDNLASAVEEAETVIIGGLQSYPDSTELLSVEAELRDCLNETDKALQILEHAFQMKPGRDKIATRLARKYRDTGEFEKAISTLEMCLHHEPTSKPVHFELGHAFIAAGDRGRAIEHFRRSFTTGDDRYEAQFWYARELFLQRNYKESRERFSALHNQAPNRFRPKASEVYRVNSNPVIYECTIRHKEDGYAFVRIPQLEFDLYAPRPQKDDSSWEDLYVRSSAKCSIAFNRRGPCAIDIQLG